MRKISEAMVYILLFMLIIIFIIIVAVSLGLAAPVGIGISGNITDNGPSYGSASSDAEGGTITTLLLNVSQQATSWKGYVGNITGQLALRDSSNYSIYNWEISSISGEVYASRASSITWTLLNCTNQSMIEAEDSVMGIPTTEINSLNKTFNNFIHKEFYVSSIEIANSSCPAIATNINSTVQAFSESAYFQEVLLDDDSSIVYVNILEQDIQGYNSNRFDFQFVLPDSYSEASATTYYFWAEIT